MVAKGPNIPFALHKGDKEIVGYQMAQEKAIRDVADTAEAAAAGAATDLAALDTRVTALENPPPSQLFVSSDQTVTASTAIAGIPHGLTLTTAPNVRAYLVCQSTELGYAAGELIQVSTAIYDFWNSGTGTHQPMGCTVSLDATNVYITYGTNVSVFILSNRSTGSFNVVDITKWKLRVAVEP